MKVYTVGHILTVTSSSDGFRLPLWYLQTCLVQELLTLVPIFIPSMHFHPTQFHSKHQNNLGHWY
jgi:hypothetical protein